MRRERKTPAVEAPPTPPTLLSQFYNDKTPDDSPSMAGPKDEAPPEDPLLIEYRRQNEDLQRQNEDLRRENVDMQQENRTLRSTIEKIVGSIHPGSGAGWADQPEEVLIAVRRLASLHVPQSSISALADALGMADAERPDALTGLYSTDREDPVTPGYIVDTATHRVEQMDTERGEYLSLLQELRNIIHRAMKE